MKIDGTFCIAIDPFHLIFLLSLLRSFAFANSSRWADATCKQVQWCFPCRSCAETLRLELFVANFIASVVAMARLLFHDFTWDSRGISTVVFERISASPVTAGFYENDVGVIRSEQAPRPCRFPGASGRPSAGSTQGTTTRLRWVLCPLFS